MGDLKRGKRKIGCCLLLPNWLAGGEHPARSAGDAGMVPLTSRETAKGGEQRTQLASLKQVSAVLQRSHPRAKRKPDPRIMHTSPEAHRWVTRDAKKDTKKVGKIIKKYLQGKLTYDIVKKLILCTSADSASGA